MAGLGFWHHLSCRIWGLWDKRMIRYYHIYCNKTELHWKSKKEYWSHGGKHTLAHVLFSLNIRKQPSFSSISFNTEGTLFILISKCWLVIWDQNISYFSWIQYLHVGLVVGNVSSPTTFSCATVSVLNSYSGKEVCHGRGGCDPVASLGFSGLAEANVHAGVGSWFVGVVVVGQKILLELAFVVVVARAVEFPFDAHGDEQTTSHPEQSHHSSLHGGNF